MSSHRCYAPGLGRLLAVALLVLTVACGGGSGEGGGVIRLFDRFSSDSVSGTPSTSAQSPDSIAWRFDGTPPTAEDNAETWGWEAGSDVRGLEVADGMLSGTSSGDFPIVAAMWTGTIDDRDVLHAVEVRIRVSDGANLAVDLSGAETIDLEQAQQATGLTSWQLTTPLQAGDDPQTYTLSPSQTVAMSGVRHVLVRPTDVDDADFDIEHVRVISRTEHLASVASGIGWQGLAEIYHETLVARSPEILSFAVELPVAPWLDLALGSPDERPVTFHVSLTASDGDHSLLEHTVTTPHRWERQRVDLAEFAGQSATLSLSLTADDEGTIGFWGTPVVRSSLGPADLEASGALGVAPQGVIFVHADTLRSDHLDMYGYERETAPILQGLAGEGARFDTVMAQGTWTKVSTPSFMTSLYPLSTGVHGFADRLPAAAITLAETYRDAGYATLALSSVLFTGQFTNLHQGYEELHESGSTETPGPKTARAYVDRIAEWLQVHRDVPFFIYLHVFDPHDPYEPYRPYDGLWADPAHKEEHEEQLDTVREVIDDPLRRNFGMPTRAELEQVEVDPDDFIAYDQGWYDGSIRAMDVEMGRLFERVRGLGLDERTLLVFTSDHGEEFFDHGQMFHGQTVYGELARVPLVMRWPGVIPADRVVDETVQLIDIMPTLLELTGLPPVDGMQGQSLVPLLALGDSAEGHWAPRQAFIEKAITNDNFSPPPRDTESYAVVDGGWKLIHNRIRPDGVPEFELYDIHEDPLDLDDRASEQTDVVERLARDIDRWQRVAEAARLPEDAASTEGMTQEQLERLRSLGYIR